MLDKCFVIPAILRISEILSENVGRFLENTPGNAVLGKISEFQL